MTPRASGGAAGLPGVHPGQRCWSRTTPASTSVSCKAACARLDLPWPRPAVVDTVRLARRVLTRDEAPSVRLGRAGAAAGFAGRARPPGAHRRRATVDVLHALFERLGSLGVHSLAELQRRAAGTSRPERRRKRRLADRLPPCPGVYLFRGPRRRGALRRHVRQPAPAGPLLLLRVRDPRPDQAHGAAGRAGRPRRVRARAGGAGPRAAADRRPPAAVQPAVHGRRARCAGWC